MGKCGPGKAFLDGQPPAEFQNRFLQHHALQKIPGRIIGTELVNIDGLILVKNKYGSRLVGSVIDQVPQAVLVNQLSLYIPSLGKNLKIIVGCIQIQIKIIQTVDPDVDLVCVALQQFSVILPGVLPGPLHEIHSQEQRTRH